MIKKFSAIKADIYRIFENNLKKVRKKLEKSVDVGLKIIKIRFRCHALKREAAKAERFEVL